MGKIVFAVIPVFLVILLTGSLSYADDQYDPAELLSIADEELFLRIGPAQDYSEAQGYVNEILDKDTIHQYYVFDGVGTDVLMTLFPASDKLMGGNKWLSFPDLHAKNFHLSLTLQRTENVPAGAGGNCWIRYSDRLLTGSGHEHGLILYPGEKAFEISDGSEIEVTDLYGLYPEARIKFDFIRIDGTVYVYADGNFLFSFHDNALGGISFEAGAMLYSFGNRIRCDFDDYTVRF